jgi:hypothetical protein
MDHKRSRADQTNVSAIQRPRPRLSTYRGHPKRVTRYSGYAFAGPRANSRLSRTCIPTGLTQRDRHLQIIADRGRMPWQKVSGYNWRALAEADISRYKRVIGDAMRSRYRPAAVD